MKLDKQAIRKLKPIQRSKTIADNLHEGITKEAYEGGKNLSSYLETLDPTNAYENPYIVGDAFNRTLAKCGIRTSSNHEMGLNASTLEDVVKHPKARFLAVEIFARAYRSIAFGVNKAATRQPVLSTMGIPGQYINPFAYGDSPRGTPLEPAIPLSEIVGQTTGINAQIYKPFYIEDVGTVTARVTEAAEIPAIKITTKENVITLKKFGRRIDSTYESMRRMPIDMIAQMIRRVAIKIETEKVEAALSVIVNGDGNTGSTPTSYNVSDLNDPAATGTTFDLTAWLAFKMKFKNPFVMTTILAQDAPALSLMLLNTGTANLPLVMVGGLVAGQGVTPINQSLSGGERVGWLDAAPASKLVAFDRRFAVERVFEIGANIQESDRDIKTQINHLVLSEVEGYAIMEGGNATKILNLAA